MALKRNKGGQDDLSDIIAKKFSSQPSSDSSSDDEDIKQFTKKLKTNSDNIEAGENSRTKMKLEPNESDDDGGSGSNSENSDYDDDDDVVGQLKDDGSGSSSHGDNDDDNEVSSDNESGVDDDDDDDEGDEEDDDHKDDEKLNEDEEDGQASSKKKDKMESIQQELMNLPFNELQKLKEKLGTKVFQQAVFGKKSSMSEHKKRVFKRANKNRPVEMSAKVPVGRHRDVISTKKKAYRDPRFDDLSGEFKEDRFHQSYSFLNDVKMRDLEKLKKKFAKEKDPEKKEQLKYLVNRMSQQEQVRKDKEKKASINRSVKKMENQQVTEGKTPFFLKKSDKRTLELAEKFRELKKSGKVEQYLSKKRKKIASKDRKRLPNNT